MRNRKSNLILIAAAASAVSPIATKAATVTYSYVSVQISAASNFTTPTTLVPIFDGTNWDITVPAGDFYRFGVAAAVTGNVNPAHSAAGTAYETGPGGVVQPANLGLASNAFSFTDSNIALSVPLLAGTNALDGTPNSTGTPQTLFNAGKNKGNVNAGTKTVGDSPTNQLGGGVFNPDASSTTGKNQVSIGANGTAANNNIFTTLGYSTTAAGGTVTLSPSIPAGTFSFTANVTTGTPGIVGTGTAASTATGTPAIAPTYGSRAATGSDTLNALAPLLVTVQGTVTATKVITLTAAANTAGAAAIGTNFSGTSNPAGATGNLVNVVGSGGGYLKGELNAITGAGKTGQAEVRFSSTVGGAKNDPGTVNIALDVTDGANAAGSAQYITDLNALIADINDATKGLGPNTAWADGNINAPASAQTALNFINLGKSGESKYDLIIQVPSSAANGLGDDFLGLDLSQDSGLAAGLKIVDIAAVPEPASMAGLLIGASGLLMGRRKRKA